MAGRQFTWANSLSEPTYEKLDCVLMDSDWEFKFPLVSIRVLPRIEALSDHAPILLPIGTPLPQCRRPFKFELGWFIGLASRSWLNLFGHVPIFPEASRSPKERRRGPRAGHLIGWRDPTFCRAARWGGPLGTPPTSPLRLYIV
jgi:hypothetical protein